ncbi:MAG: uracil phosphoribosyltransferase [Sumerlaeia bacterium]
MPLKVADHPLITHKLTIIRDKDTSVKKFREIVEEITLLLTYEATRDLPLSDALIETPLCPMTGRVVKERFVITPILRAGLGMLHGMMSIFPVAKVSHIGLERDEETALPRTYYYKSPPDLAGSHVIIIDPMLATGGSLSAAVDLIKRGQPSTIKCICLLAAPEGRDRMNRDHPDVDVYVGALDERLNEKAYIVPGLGDAGDRMYGTL